jgi:formate hydrogenlyase transcriptional activator
MLAYDWPGNVRELQNFIERGVIVSQGAVFELPLEKLRLKKVDVPREARTLEDATREHILQVLQETKWVVGGRHGAAARLGIARTTLLSKMRRLGIESAADGFRERSLGRSHAFASA